MSSRKTRTTIECAVSAGAQYIVTGDKDLLRVKTYDGIDITKVANFLKIVKGQQDSSRRCEQARPVASTCNRQPAHTANPLFPRRRKHPNSIVPSNPRQHRPLDRLPKLHFHVIPRIPIQMLWHAYTLRRLRPRPERRCLKRQRFYLFLTPPRHGKRPQQQPLRLPDRHYSARRVKPMQHHRCHTPPNSRTIRIKRRHPSIRWLNQTLLATMLIRENLSNPLRAEQLNGAATTSKRLHHHDPANPAAHQLRWLDLRYRPNDVDSPVYK